MKKLQIITSIGQISILSLFLFSCGKPEVKPVSLTMSAGISLKSSLQEIKELYIQEKPNVTITYKFGRSSDHQKAIEQGSVVDIYITGNDKNMDNLQSKGLLLVDTRQNLLRNKIVLFTSKNTASISDFKDLTKPQVKKIVLGDPKQSAPGRYASEVLTSLGILNSVKPKFILLKTGVEAVSHLEQGRADAGLGYATDVILSDRVKIVAIAPENSHSPIIYPIAVLKNSKNIPEAKEFIQFLKSEPAKAVFLKYLFTTD